MSKILITGGTGLIGTELSGLLSQRGHSVCWLTRRVETLHPYPSFRWDGYSSIDPSAFDEVTTVIHLAGAGVFDRRWTSAYKKTILDSRVESTQFLMQSIKRYGSQVKLVIGSSASGFYGGHLHGNVFKEMDPAGDDFLASVCKAWEEAYSVNQPEGVGLAMVRTGIVLSPSGGAYARLRKLFKMGVGSPLGTGNQIMPWIHSHDLCRLYLTLAELGAQGVYNGVAPEKISNRIFSKELARCHSHGWMLPAVPSVLLSLVLGESARVLTTGAYLSTAKVEGLPFDFQFPTLRAAIADLEHKP